MATAWRMSVSVRTVVAIAGRALKLALSQTAKMNAPTSMTCQPWKRRRESAVDRVLMVSGAPMAMGCVAWVSPWLVMRND